MRRQKGVAVLSGGTVLDPFAIGTVASLGINVLEVARVPEVVVFASGDEVIPTRSHCVPA